MCSCLHISCGEVDSYSRVKENASVPGQALIHGTKVQYNFRLDVYRLEARPVSIGSSHDAGITSGVPHETHDRGRDGRFAVTGNPSWRLGARHFWSKCTVSG